jgi:hypothetical protein
VVEARVHFFNSEGDPLVLAEVELEAGTRGKVACLLDSGASGSFVRCSSGLLEGARKRQCEVPKRMVSLDGTKAQGESIREWVEAKVDLGGGLRTVVQRLDIAEVGGPDVILGTDADWHQENGVIIDWNTMTVALRGKGWCPEMRCTLQRGLQRVLEERGSRYGVRRSWKIRKMKIIRKTSYRGRRKSPPKRTPHPDSNGCSDGASRRTVGRVGCVGTTDGVYPEDTQDELSGDMEKFRQQAVTGELDFLGNNDDEDLEAEEILEMVLEEFHAWLDVFRKSKVDSLPPCREYDHEIEIDPSVPLRAGPTCPMTRSSQEAWFQEYLTGAIAMGHFRPSTSPVQ